MNINITLNYSPNFNPKKRKVRQIKFIIFHYTGMKTDTESLNRLTNIKSEVSCHYLIKNNGEIVMMVPDLYVAWHAGKSHWKNFKSLNKNSIGIEISNPGHNFRYKKFSKKQIQSILKISKFLIRKYKIKKKINILSKKNFYNNLSKIGYLIKNPKEIKKDEYLNLVTKAFQRRFRQELINGEIDQECLLISQNLAKKLN